jgi:protein-L-isoaspartate(D-aspartate) O-methyltransferase
MRIRSRPDEAELRRQMVERQIRRRGIEDARVLDAMRQVPRHLFVPPEHHDAAYADCALPIGYGATISQPYIVARMTAALAIDRDGFRVLEVGTGSGYQAAVLAACGCRVWSVERIPELHARAGEVLRHIGFSDEVHLRLGDGSRGWPEEAPFSGILVTAAAREPPDALAGQMEKDGRMVAPVGGEWSQVLRLYRPGPDDRGLVGEDLEGARFVPLVVDPPSD